MRSPSPGVFERSTMITALSYTRDFPVAKTDSSSRRHVRFALVSIVGTAIVVAIAIIVVCVSPLDDARLRLWLFSPSC